MVINGDSDVTGRASHCRSLRMISTEITESELMDKVGYRTLQYLNATSVPRKYSYVRTYKFLLAAKPVLGSVLGLALESGLNLAFSGPVRARFLELLGGLEAIF